MDHLQLLLIVLVINLLATDQNNVQKVKKLLMLLLRVDKFKFVLQAAAEKMVEYFLVVKVNFVQNQVKKY